MIKSVDNAPISDEETLSILKQARANLLKSEERLDYLTRKTYLIKLEIDNKIFFLCEDDSLSVKFGGAIKFKRKCEAQKELMLYMERAKLHGCNNVKLEIVIEKELLKKSISHLKKQLTKEQ